MSLHHVAFATNDTAATHSFYTDLMGFRLAKVVAAPTPQGGWAKHLFYDTGGAGRDMIAFWELHLPGRDRVPSAISTDLGLPDWVNHLAFRAEDREELDRACRRWQEAGIEVVEIDHGFCVSIYAHDPNGILVEWCMDTRPLDAQDAAQAAASLVDPQPPFDPPAGLRVHPALT